MNQRKSMNTMRVRRMIRTRARIHGTKEMPRLAVFRSNRHFYAQLIDDDRHTTIVSVSAKDLSAAAAKGAKSARAALLGERMAEKAKEKGTKKAVFDRRRYRYHGRVKAFVEGVRKGGLTI